MFEVDVTDEQVAFFRENGYLAVDRITTDEEIEWLRARNTTRSKPRRAAASPTSCSTSLAAYGSHRGARARPAAVPRAAHARARRHRDVPQRASHLGALARCRRCRHRELGPPHLQTAACRCGHALAPRRGVLGGRPLVPRARCVDPARRDVVENGCLWFVPGFAPRRGVASPPSRRRPGRAHPRVRGRSRPLGRGARAVARRRRRASTTRARSTAPTRTPPTVRAGRGRTSSSSRR